MFYNWYFLYLALNFKKKHDPSLFASSCELCIMSITRWLTIKFWLGIRKYFNALKISRMKKKMKYLDQIVTLSLSITVSITYHRHISIYPYSLCVSAHSVFVPLCNFSTHARGKSCPCLEGHGESAEGSLHAIIFLCTICIYSYWNKKSNWINVSLKAVDCCVSGGHFYPGPIN